MAESAKSPSNKEKIWYDPEEFAIRKRLPPSLPRRAIDVYVTNKTAFKAQLARCKAFIDKGEPEFYLHSLGAAIPRALNLALQLQKDHCETVTLETITSTVELTDDFEPLRSNDQPQQQSRHTSAVHIKVVYNAEPASDKCVKAPQEQ